MGSSAAEEQIKNQYVLQRIKMQHDFASDKERIELDAYIASEQRKAELNARLSLCNVHAEETAAMNLEMERLKRPVSLISRCGNKSSIN